MCSTFFVAQTFVGVWQILNRVSLALEVFIADFLLFARTITESFRC
jgi:hypothetical protein